jgi:hypothetical protein
MSRQSSRGFAKLQFMKIPTRLLSITALLSLAALGPIARAVVPPPDGGYPNFNTAEGQKALFSLTSGAGNAAVGAFSLFADTQGSFNTATGAGTLLLNTADQNTAMGAAALLNNTTGGTFAGTFGNTDVGPNVAVGALALGQNTTGGANTALGYQALGNMTLGNANQNNGGFSTAVGFKALASADTSSGGFAGTSNDAFGYEALTKNTTGNFNVGIGNRALLNNTTGGSNVAVGQAALFNNTTGEENTALGVDAGLLATTGGGNVYVGANVLGVDGETGHTYIANVNTTPVNGITVVVDSNTGLLGHVSSSRRYKEDIQPMDQASETLFSLKPVTFRYKKEVDQSQSLDYGLIAEEVAQIDPNLAVHNKDGQIESVRYNAVNAMLLNEFLKEHRTVLELKKEITALSAMVKAQAAQIQNVSAEVAMSRSASQQVVVRNP